MPYSESVCREVVLKLGLELGKIGKGGKDYAFAATKTEGYQMGCYTYKSGVGYDHYVGIAFYGRGGDNDEMSKPFDESSIYYRPKGHDCGIKGNVNDFVSSMS